jgi:hypothetical protein
MSKNKPVSSQISNQVTETKKPYLSGAVTKTRIFLRGINLKKVYSIVMVMTTFTVAVYMIGMVIDARNDTKYQEMEAKYATQITLLQQELEWRTTSKYNPKLVDWVYKKASKNPLKLCKEMVDFTYKHAEYPKTLIALMARESAFDQFATSPVNAKGLTQVMWKSWSKELIAANKGITEERDLYDWQKSILAGDYILKTLHKQYKGDWKKLLKHYVGGKHPTYKDDIFRYIGELTVIEESNPTEELIVDISSDEDQVEAEETVIESTTETK